MTERPATPASARPAPRRLWLVILLTSLYWTFDLGVLGAGVPHPLDDTWEYGVVAHHLLAGDGFRTHVIHPPLWSLRDSSLTVPVLIHGPVLPLLLTPLIGGLGPAALDGIGWIAAAFAVLAAVATYRIGDRHLGPAGGACAAALLTLSPLTLHAVHHDVSPMMAAGLLALALDGVAGGRPRPLLAGLSLGIAGLVRPELLVAAPLLAAATPRTGRVVVLAGTLACALPWWWHNLRAAGTPLFNLSSYLLIAYWGRYPELTALRDFHLTPDRWPAALAAAAPSLPGKWIAFFPHAVKRALTAPSGLTGWLAAFGAWSWLAGRPAGPIAVAALLAAAVPITLATATIYSERVFVPFLPLWTLAAAGGAAALGGRLAPLRRRPWVCACVAVALTLPSTLGAIRESAEEAPMLRQWLAEERAALRARMDPAAGVRPMFSDTPDFVAWTTGRPTVWVTRAEHDRLPARAASGGDELPRRGRPGDLWFHADPRSPEPRAAAPGRVRG